jgi:hypothetical protein
VQLVAGVKVPVELDANVTLPVGVITVPAVEMSVTVAVQLVPWLTTTDAGVHETVVEVVRGDTAKLKEDATVVELAA